VVVGHHAVRASAFAAGRGSSSSHEYILFQAVRAFNDAVGTGEAQHYRQFELVYEACLSSGGYTHHEEYSRIRLSMPCNDSVGFRNSQAKAR